MISSLPLVTPICFVCYGNVSAHTGRQDLLKQKTNWSKCLKMLRSTESHLLWESLWETFRVETAGGLVNSAATGMSRSSPATVAIDQEDSVKWWIYRKKSNASLNAIIWKRHCSTSILYTRHFNITVPSRDVYWLQRTSLNVARKGIQIKNSPKMKRVHPSVAYTVRGALVQGGSTAAPLQTPSLSQLY